MDFSQIAILVGSAAMSGILAKLARQPLLVGYLFAGGILSVLGLIPDRESLSQLSKIGVALLLFLVGIEMKLSELPTIGKVALVTGLGQIIFTSVVGFFLATLLGFDTLPAIYIAVALTFSSTIIIVKLLSEKNDLSSLYGRIAVGFLLVQDLVAILILMFLSGVSRGEFGLSSYVFIAVKAVILLSIVWFLSHRILPAIFTKIVDQSTELLFIVSIAWALCVAAFVGGPLGFGIEIGGFLAGIAISNLPDHLQIATRTRPLRDFFLTVFFLMLGANLLVSGIFELLAPAVILSLFVLIGNPIIVLVIMGVMGYKKRTSFLASVTVAQISEFSFILMAMGASLGQVSEQNVALVVLVGIITMTLSTYLITNADKVYRKIAPVLSVFERKGASEFHPSAERERKDHVVLIGSHRTGTFLISILKKRKIDFVVVDFNPVVFYKLSIANTPVIFGDITEEEIMEAAGVTSARLVISTTADLYDNLVLLDYIRSRRSKVAVILKASTRQEAETLYTRGADYVIVPEVMAGEHIRHLIKTQGIPSSKKVRTLGRSHLKRLRKLY